jgi:hypothetical protein
LRLIAGLNQFKFVESVTIRNSLSGILAATPVAVKHFLTRFLMSAKAAHYKDFRQLSRGILADSGHTKNPIGAGPIGLSEQIGCQRSELAPIQDFQLGSA